MPKATSSHMSGQPAFRRAAGVLLALLTMGLPTSLVLLDAGEASVRARAESSHDPGRCAVLHDHAACVQLLQSHGRPVEGTASLGPGEATAAVPALGASLPHRPGAVSTRHARAPPLLIA